MSRPAKTRTPRTAPPGQSRSAAVGPSPTWWRHPWFLGFLLVAATLLAYQPVWHAGFLRDDDDIYITENPLLTAPDGLWRIWFSLDSPSQYFPLVYTVFRWEHALWGLNPSGYHWVNLVLHSINGLLAWQLLRRLNVPGAWLGAALWTLHPVQVESVAWVVEFKNVLMGFFFLLSLLSWTRFVREAPGQRWRFYALTLIFYALALFAKTTACTLPLALLLISWWLNQRIGGRRIMEIAPFVILGLGMGLVTVWWERFHQGTQGGVFSLSLVDRVLVASHALWFYAGKVLWPAPLVFCYPRWTINPANPLAYGWLAATAAVVAGLWQLRHRLGRGVPVALLFFVTTLGPLLGFIMLYTFAFSFVADHYQYVADAGLLALLAAVLAARAARWQPRRPGVEAAVCLALLLPLGALTWRQAQNYRTDETLWQATLRQNPGCWLAANNLALDYLVAGRLPEAEALCDKALSLKPDFASAALNLGNVYLQEGRRDDALRQFQKTRAMQADLPGVNDNLGLLELQTGRLTEAVASFQNELKLQPDSVDAAYNLANAYARQGQTDRAMAEYQKVLSRQPDHYQALNNLGVVDAQAGNLNEAIAQYQKAIAVAPNFADAHNNLGRALDAQGHAGQAMAEYQKALTLRPDYAQARNNLAQIYVRLGRPGEAIAQYQQALASQPDNLDLLNNLAWLLATCPQSGLRQGETAVALAQRADQLTGDANAVVLCTLGAAYAEAGHFPEALAAARHARQLAQSPSDATLAHELDSQISLYAGGLPFHSP